MTRNIHTLLTEYTNDIKDILGDSLEKIILYGSYARGDNQENSDIDLMILVSVAPEEIGIYTDKIYDLSYDYDEKYGIEINPCIQNINTFNHWKRTYPFFINIEKEGIAV